MATEVPTCSYNGCKLTPAEIAEPYMHDGEMYCEECDEEWRIENESECSFCCDWFEDDDLSECFVVVDVEDVEPGLYRPLEYPYYAAPMIGRSTFYDGAIERIGSLLRPERIDTGYPCAFVCKQCMGEAAPWWNPITRRWDGKEEERDGDTVHT